MIKLINIILTNDITNLGKIGHICQVKAGYARNFLFPKQLALPISSKKIKDLQHKKNIISKKIIKLNKENETLKLKLNKTILTFYVKTSKKEKIFGSINARMIAEQLNTLTYNIHHKKIQLPSPIKTIGIHNVNILLNNNITAQIKIKINEETENK